MRYSLLLILSFLLSTSLQAGRIESLQPDTISIGTIQAKQTVTVTSADTSQIRTQAETLVRLSDDNPFEFLSHLNRPFSLWEQITLHELIIQHDLPVPSFKKWLTQPNGCDVCPADDKGV